MSDICNEWKVIIEDAIRSLYLKVPAKHESMLVFLSGLLRDEHRYDFERTESGRRMLTTACTIAVKRSLPIIPPRDERNRYVPLRRDCLFPRLPLRYVLVEHVADELVRRPVHAHRQASDDGPRPVKGRRCRPRRE